MQEKLFQHLKCFLKIDNFSKKNILCLASRDGAEVKAFRQLNANCIGIDLIYPENSKYVHYGDFHDIPYPDGVFDYVFTNSLDHSFDIQKIIMQKILLQPLVAREVRSIMSISFFKSIVALQLYQEIFSFLPKKNYSHSSNNELLRFPLTSCQ